MAGRIFKFFLFTFWFFLLSQSTQAAIEKVLPGDSIPERLYVGSRFIIENSDSLFLNNRLLRRDIDYRFEAGYGYFDLSGLSFSSGDTLRLRYTITPSWLSRNYGRPLPEVSPTSPTTERPLDLFEQPVSKNAFSEIDISGTKTFRVSARSAGSSEFNQSLDLKISGEISPGLEISGAVSDRGYDPSYGTANSRLNEIDKINVQLKSKALLAQVGDIDLTSHTYARHNKSVSGVMFDLQQSKWYVTGAVARPKGIFETYRTLGLDNFQGPYQVGTASKTVAIVPGSESVWLDGEKMERGSDQDYTIDYVLGRITFNANQPIDGRSRIEIDYEPQATDYKQELLSTGGGIHLKDSSFYLSASVLREGDDKNQPLIGELSSADIDQLEQAGDNRPVRSGIIPDSTGSYILIADSLPDSVYQYVGPDNGDFRITFSYVGSGNGAYRFVGGERYEFVGDSTGDYLPVVFIPTPQRTDYWSTTVGVKNSLVGRIQADISGTSFDRNLFSSIDDADNEGLYYDVYINRQWQRYGRENSVYVRRKFTESTFRRRYRLERVDFDRAFYLPENYIADADETVHDVSTSLSPVKFLSLDFFYANLDYKHSFNSRRGGVGTKFYISDRLGLSGNWYSTRTEKDSTVLDGKGQVDNWRSEINYRPFNRVRISTSFENDRRENRYFDNPRGTRFNRFKTEISSEQLVGITYEYYDEDTLTGGWQDNLKRHRLSGSARSRFGRLQYDLTMTYQILETPAFDENNFLSRINLQYSRPEQKLSVRSSYLVSEERRNARGITYLEVEPGQGEYIYEDGQYVRDPDGNYIQVEEILSDIARVRRGQKSFDFRKDWHYVLAHFYSDIEEELLPEGKREISWVLPFYSDNTQPYLYFRRNYDTDIRFFPWAGFHFINIAYNENLQIRQVAAIPRRSSDRQVELALKQKVVNSYFQESYQRFESERDEYYSGAGDIDGFKFALEYRQQIAIGELSFGSGYRKAESAFNERSRIYSVLTGTRFRFFQNSEFRTTLELYRQELDNAIGTPSYKLTGNKPGEKGAEWRVSFNYGIKSGVRINLNISGRHADNRTARIYGQGEIIAGF